MAYALPISGYGQSYGGYQGQNQGGINPLLLLITQLIGQATGGQSEARQANESRYQDILKLFGDTRNRVLGDLNSVSDQEIVDANQKYDDMRNNLLTDLADRGFAGSTKRLGVEAMTKRERDAAVNRIKDTLNLNRSAADERFTDKAAGVMERRTDSYPQTNVAALISQLAPLLGGLGGGIGFGQQYGQTYGGNVLRGGGNAPLGTGGGMGGNRNPWGGGQPGVPRQIPAASTPAGYFNGVYAPGAAVNARNAAARADENAAYDRDIRNRAMADLRHANNGGGWTTVVPERQALDYIQANNIGSYDPVKATSAIVDMTPRYNGGYIPYPVYPQQANQPYSRVPLRQRDPVFASVLDQRRMTPQQRVDQWAQSLGATPSRPAATTASANPITTPINLIGSFLGLW